MTNEEAIKRLTILTDYEYDEDLEALEMGIKALKETDNHGNCDLTMFGDCSYKETGCSDCKIKEKIREALKKADAFVHVRFTHPRFGEADGWVDRQRQLLFFDWITLELAQKYNWTWKEADNEYSEKEERK